MTTELVELADRLSAVWTVLNDDGDEHGACDTIHEAIQALASRACGSDGFVLVPREPTREMIAAALIARDERIKANAVSNGGRYKIGGTAPGDTMAGTYRAMLAAAPEPVAVG